MEESLIEQLGLQEEYKLVTQVGNKKVYAHTLYYEVEEPDYEQFITEDDTPVDNIFSEIQQRLLIDPLFINQWTTRDFWASANVGIYYAMDKPCVIPDMFLSFDVTKPDTWFDKKDKCYFTWLVGKVPDLVVEVVSNKIGKEDGDKKNIYAKMGVKYYILVDPYRYLSEERLRVFRLHSGTYEQVLETHLYMEEVNLGIMIWEGLFEKEKAPWARWCSKEGNLLTTGAETTSMLKDNLEQANEIIETERMKTEEERTKKIQERQRAEQEALKAEQERQRAEQEALKAEQERQRAEQERQRAEKLLAQLKSLGLSPEE